MRYYQSVQCLLIFFALRFASLGCYAKVQILNLYEDDVCQRSFNELPDDVCRDFRKCSYFDQAFKNGKRPAICSFKNKIPIICCPSDPFDKNIITSSNVPSNNVSSNKMPPNTGLSNIIPTNNNPNTTPTNSVPFNNEPPKNTPSDISPTNITPPNTAPSNNRPFGNGPSNITPSNTIPFNNKPSSNGPSNNRPSNNWLSNNTPPNTSPSNITPSNNRPSNNWPSNNTPPNSSPSNITPSSNRPSNNWPSNNIPPNTSPSNITPSNNRPSNNWSSDNDPSKNTPQNTSPFNNTPSKNVFSDKKVTAKTYSADEMCHEYSKLIYKKITNTYKEPFIEQKDCIDVKPINYGGGLAEPKEFPHMALLGYQEFVNNIWNCAGSVISKRWILSSAHCKTFEGNFVQWARLGELNTAIDNDGTVHKDYKIQQRIIHPDYHETLGYNDIALFGLEKFIEFSAFIRPICLNTDFSMQSSLAVSIGLGTAIYGSLGKACSDSLLKVTLDILPLNHCQTTFSYNKNKLPRGIEDDSMLCVGSLYGDSFRCSGMSGEPIHIKNYNYTCMYTQIAVTSFWNDRSTVDKPTIYTKVSNYIPWVEKIVWPINQ